MPCVQDSRCPSAGGSMLTIELSDVRIANGQGLGLGRQATMIGESLLGDKAYVWLVVLLILELALLVYTGLFVSERMGGGLRLDTNPTRTSRSGAGAGSSSLGAAGAASAQLVCEQESYSGAISVVRPGIVFIQVRYLEATRVDAVAGTYVFDSGAAAPGRRIGSGVIVDRSGYILTNHHVIANAIEVNVTPFSSQRQTFNAVVVRDSERDDLALLKIDAGYDLPEVTLADSDRVEVGDVVLAIGSPFGMEHTVTLGIISDDRRSVVIDGHLYNEMLQTDAAINRGNSGGALVDIKGEVVGINTAIFAPTGVFTGVGFAIPANRAKPMLAQHAQGNPLVQSPASGL